jgi:hypothetical protein
MQAEGVPVGLEEVQRGKAKEAAQDGLALSALVHQVAAQRVMLIYSFRNFIVMGILILSKSLEIIEDAGEDLQDGGVGGY